MRGAILKTNEGEEIEFASLADLARYIDIERTDASRYIRYHNGFTPEGHRIKWSENPSTTAIDRKEAKRKYDNIRKKTHKGICPELEFRDDLTGEELDALIATYRANNVELQRVPYETLHGFISITPCKKCEKRIDEHAMIGSIQCVNCYHFIGKSKTTRTIACSHFFGIPKSNRPSKTKKKEK